MSAAWLENSFCVRSGLPNALVSLAS
jgi:hypothetical protein